MTSTTPYSFWASVFAFSVFKLLFFNSYRSTDFEVHRNWLAITNSLPLNKWYYEDTSEWTLDYPPTFAYFEWLLSLVGQWVDPGMVVITELNYASTATIVFQKVSVILSDLVMALSLNLFTQNTITGRSMKDFPMVLFILIFTNAGLFIVDHIHFQYNGFLFGILLLSIAFILQGKYLLGAFIFSVLLTMKHIFLYMSPAFGVYLFSKYCISKEGKIRMDFGNLLRLASIVSGVAAVSFGPFFQHLPQVFQRLFPFQRGLSHAYWAPNVWVAYNTLDLSLSIVAGRKSNVTGGLVGDHGLAILPQVLPVHTFVLTLIFMLPCLYKLWKNPTGLNFVRGVILTSWTAFMFGYHVHEKAILNVIIPFALIGPAEPELFLITLISSTFSLFPLLFTPFENVLKVFLTLGHFCLVVNSVIPLPKFKLYEGLYLVGFLPLIFVHLVCSVVLPKYPFLPLVCTSDYCFLGLFYSWAKFYWKHVVHEKGL